MRFPGKCRNRPKKRPHPNIYFFKMRYMQQMFAGQQAAGAHQCTPAEYGMVGVWIGLIKPTGTRVNRIGTNAFPTPDDWDYKGYLWSMPRATRTLKQPPSHGLRSVLNKALIFKVGTTTGHWERPRANPSPFNQYQQAKQYPTLRPYPSSISPRPLSPTAR